MESVVLLVNDTELVVIEKTTFMPENVYDLKEKLKEFKAFLPQFKNYSAYGTLAALKYDGSSDKYAYRNVFFGNPVFLTIYFTTLPGASTPAGLALKPKKVKKC
jgi:hypothetical protein